ncbi:hypothetical protein CcI49_18825 [Frankia sp. CcI49]|nr:hypothetical protein CcI49_18825 [Frankia sp. CcI49]
MIARESQARGSRLWLIVAQQVLNELVVSDVEPSRLSLRLTRDATACLFYRLAEVSTLPKVYQRQIVDPGMQLKGAEIYE